MESEAIGVEHTFIYDFKDDGQSVSDYDNFGLVKSDRSPKQTYFALQRATGLLAAMRDGGSCQTGFHRGRSRQSKQDGLGDRMSYVLQL